MFLLFVSHACLSVPDLATCMRAVQTESGCIYFTICLLPGNFSDCKPCALTGLSGLAGGATRRSAADVRHGIVTMATQKYP